jgi:hypothetical protein
MSAPHESAPHESAPRESAPYQSASGDSDLAAEAARLLAQLQDWAQRSAGAPHAAAGAQHGSAECQWCPVCQFIAVLRGERPEVTERVTEAGVAVVTALRGLLDAVVGAAAPPDTGWAADDARAQARVQHIDLGDATE